ncbi:MAG TPA: hypothetical protein P5572_08625 [Phycisphaerae bacterium]|nr:hypothetical protein [Phycisphaerales bacterium]HRX85068.1 hypothetical protein [Phycisphaerae bacterium]
MTASWCTAAEVGFIALAAALCALQAFAGALRTSRRYRLAWTMPEALAEPPTPSAAVQSSTTVLAWAALLLGALLVVTATPSWHSSVWRGVVLAAGAFACGGTVFRNLQSAWSPVRATLGAAFITIGACFLINIVLGLPQAVSGQWGALVVACACSVALWTWLAGVWRQQLEGDKAWTAAGRMISLTEALAAGNAAIGLFAAFWLCSLPSANQRPSRFFSVTVVALLVGALGAGQLRWRNFRFVILLIAGLSCMLVLTILQ